MVKDVMDDQQGGRHGELADGVPTNAARERANDRRDKIAHEMWQEYQNILQERGLDNEFAPL
jgi:hypothetical protein